MPFDGWTCPKCGNPADDRCKCDVLPDRTASVGEVVYVCGSCEARLDGIGAAHSCGAAEAKAEAGDEARREVARLRAENERLREALAELRAELSNFGQYSRTVVEDAMGLNRLTWIERAEWAERLAELAGSIDERNAT